MTLTPRETHDLEQMGARLRDIARIVGNYRTELVERGVPEPEAWAAAQRIEARFAEIVFGDYEESVKDRRLGLLIAEITRDV